MNKNLKVFLYVLAWIISWFVFSSIINAGLITTNVYSEEEKGKVITFFIGAILFLFGGTSLYKEVFTNEK